MAELLRLPGVLYTAPPSHKNAQPVATIGAICRIDDDLDLYILTSGNELIPDHVTKDERSRGTHVSRDVFSDQSDYNAEVPISTEMFVYKEFVLMKLSPTALERNQNIKQKKTHPLTVAPSDLRVQPDELVRLLTPFSNAQYGKIVAANQDVHTKHNQYIKNAIIIKQLNHGHSFATSSERGALVVIESPDDICAVAIVVYPDQIDLEVDNKIIRNATIAVPLHDAVDAMSQALFSGARIKFYLEAMNCFQRATTEKNSTGASKSTPSFVLASSKVVKVSGYIEGSGHVLNTHASNPETNVKVESTIPSKSSQISLKRRTGPPTSSDYTRFAKINVGPEGGKFTVRSLGIELRIPPGALKTKQQLTVSIPRGDANWPLKWKILSPYVRIEPEDVEYQKPIKLLIDHSLLRFPGNKSHNAPKPPILLYRHHEKDPWQIIRTQNICNEAQLRKETGLEMCADDKYGFVHPTYVAVEMSSNCDVCLVEHPNEFGIQQSMRRVGVEVYASVIQSNIAEFRVHATHGIHERRRGVQELESNIAGSHFIRRGTMFVNPLNNKTSVKIQFHHRVRADQGYTVQEKEIPFLDLSNEWTSSPDVPPHVTFIVSSQTNGHSLELMDVRILPTHGELRSMGIEFITDLSQIDHGPSSTLVLEGSDGEHVDSVPWDDEIKRRTNILLESLSWQQIQKIGQKIGFEIGYPDNETIREIHARALVSAVVDSRAQLLGLLEELNILTDTLRQRLK